MWLKSSSMNGRESLSCFNPWHPKSSEVRLLSFTPDMLIVDFINRTILKLKTKKSWTWQHTYNPSVRTLRLENPKLVRPCLRIKSVIVCCLFSFFFRPLHCSRSPERCLGSWCCEVQCGNRSSAETCSIILRYGLKRYSRKALCNSISYILHC